MEHGRPVKITRFSSRSALTVRPPWTMIVFGFIFALMLANPGGLLKDPDTLWHTATGRWIIINRTIPVTDPFSHTMAGAPWHTHEWLSGVLLAVAHAVGGWAGVAVLAATAIAGALALMFHALAGFVRPIHAGMMVILSCLIVLPHLQARPHLLMMPVAVAWLAALVSARAENRVPPLPLALLLAIWANLHASFVIGIGILVVLALEALWAARRSPTRGRLAGRWGLFFCLAALGGMATPHGWNGYLFPLQVQGMDTALSQIGEWKPYNAQNTHLMTGWLFFGFAVAFYRGLRIPPFRLVLVLTLLYMAFLHQRHADLLGLFVPLLLAPCIAAQWPDVAARPSPPGAAPLFGAGRIAKAARVAGAAVLALVLVAGGTVFLRIRGAAPDPDVAPAAALQAAREAGLSGPVLNAYNFGGYLIYSGVPTFIDGRADMFGDEFFARFIRMRDPAAGTDELTEVLEEYDIGWSLTDANDSLAKKLDSLPGWERIHADETAVVHARVGEPLAPPDDRPVVRP